MNALGPAPGWRDPGGPQPVDAAPHPGDGWWRWTLPPDEAGWSMENQHTHDQDPPASATIALLIRLLAITVPLLVVVVVA
jgi:hypothetical protein